MVPLKSLLSDGTHTPSLFVCRSWAKVSESPSLKKRYRNVLYATEGQDF